MEIFFIKENYAKEETYKNMNEYKVKYPEGDTKIYTVCTW